MTAPNFKTLKIAVVEDHPRMREIIAKMLEALGFARIDVYEGAEEALLGIGFSDDPVDLAITDLRMQPTDGIEFIKRMRESEDEHIREMPVIVLSGHGDQEAVERAIDAGANLFVSKPVSATDLARRILRVMTPEEKKDGEKPTSSERVWT